MSAEDATAGKLAAGATDTKEEETTRDPRFFWLTVFQYALIAAVTITFVVGIIVRLNKLEDLANLDTARGLITFVITVGTVAIAIMLALTAIMTREFDKRLVVGKEILTILVAVLGTIVGFYYGASTKPATPGGTGGASNPAAISIEAPKLERDSKGDLHLSTNITGGTKPYEYGVTFTPDTIAPITNKKTEGPVTEPIALPTPAPTDIIVTIHGKDQTGADFAFNKDGKIKTPVPKQ